MKVGSAAPEVDVIIAVHQLNRPIKRAVQSALASGAPGQVGVIVVGHGLAVSDVWDLLNGCPADLVRVVRHDDGIRSAAGPFNAGLKLASAEFVCVMGSDDMLEPGVVRAWVAQAGRNSIDVVLAPLKFQSGSIIRTPRLRPIRRTILDPVRDRIAYRTAPLGLLRRSTLQRMHLEFTEGLATGEDVSLSLRLWFGNTRIAMGLPGGCYVIGEDAVERVTQHILPLDEEFTAFFGVLQEPWFRTLSARERRSVAIKIARIHILASISRRGVEWEWDGADGRTIQLLLLELAKSAPGFMKPFCRADRRILEVFSRKPLGSGGIRAELISFGSEKRLDRLITENFWENFLIESNIRYFTDVKLANVLRRRVPRIAA